MYVFIWMREKDRETDIKRDRERKRERGKEREEENLGIAKLGKREI